MTPTTRERADVPLALTDVLAPHAQRVLEAAGAVARRRGVAIYAVGGCVRDWLLGSAVADLDLVVEGDGIAVARQVARTQRAELTVHAQFKTATVTVPAARPSRRPAQRAAPALRLDFASCRQEVYTKPAAYPKVRAGTLKQDLMRRDVTINAMAMRLEAQHFGELVDYFHGYDDLQTRLIRVLHARSFHDDPSRILRVIRLAARLHFAVEEQTAGWMRTAVQARMLEQLNRGRLRKELLAMLDEPEPVACLTSLGQWLLGAHVR